MQFHNLLTLSIAAAFSGIVQATIVPAHADTHSPTSATIGQANFRGEAPVGQLNPSRPIRIDVVNGGDVPIIFEITQPSVIQRELPPNGTISFGTTHTSYLPPPVILLAYPPSENLEDIGINLYVVSVENNIVEVVVSEQLSDIPGDRSIEIDTNGFVYSY